MKYECDGACEEHTGDVRLVKVLHGSKSWGQFAYCETAVAFDRDHGLTVEPIDQSTAPATKG